MELLRHARELGDDVAPVRSIAAFELHCAPADFVQHVGERTAALSAAPAVHEGPPFARPRGESGVEHGRDVARDDRGAELAGRERRGRVERTHAGALGVVEHRMVRRRRDAILRELGGAAHVDAVGVLGEGIDADAAHAGVRSALRVHGPLNGLL